MESITRSRLPALSYPKLVLVAFTTTTMLLGGCQMPKAMRVDTTNHPKYIDKDVLFTTKYYFRVYDYCADSKTEPAILADALYRFRMTGKANALTTSVKFESGTLRKSQIEPFGSTVEYDPNTRRWSYRSHEDVEAQRERTEHIDESKLLLEFALDARKKAVDAGVDPKKLTEALETEIPELLKDGIAAARRNIAAAAPAAMREGGGGGETTPEETPAASGTNGSGDAVDPDGEVTNKACRQLARGFQILGPEGWREFDQNDRLVLAMSSSAAPLVSTLKELSGRVLNASADSPAMDGVFLQEQLRVLNAESQLERLDFSDDEEVANALQRSTQALTPGDSASQNGGRQ